MFARFRQGDEAAYAGFFRSWFPALCLYAEKLTGQQTAAEDIAQNSLIRLWEKRQKLKSPEHLRNFLYTVTRNACIDLLRDSKKRKTVRLSELNSRLPDLPDETNAQQYLIISETLRLLSQVFHALPNRQRTAFHLTILEGKKYPEAAKIMSIDPETVRSQRNAAIKAIRKKLGLL